MLHVKLLNEWLSQFTIIKKTNSLTFNIYLSLRNYDDETFSKTAIVRIGNYLLLIQFTTVVAKCQHLKWLLWFEECYYDWSNEPAVKALDNKVLEILLLRFHFSLELLEGRAQVLLLQGGEGQQRPPGSIVYMWNWVADAINYDKEWVAIRHYANQPARPLWL